MVPTVERGERGGGFCLMGVGRAWWARVGVWASALRGGVLGVGGNVFVGIGRRVYRKRRCFRRRRVGRPRGGGATRRAPWGGVEAVALGTDQRHKHARPIR